MENVKHNGVKLGLYDTQWMNCVNDPQVLALDTSKEDAVNRAVELAEKYCIENAKKAIAAAEEAQPAEPVVSGWIDPNDKTQKQFLPHIGEPVLFCHDGVTYYGIHTGGSFKTGQGVTARLFGTWDCQWMYPPAAAQKGGA